MKYNLTITLFVILIFDSSSTTIYNYNDHFYFADSTIWDYEYSRGTGYQNCPVTIDGRKNTICEIGILSIFSGTTYSDGNLHEPNNIHSGEFIYEVEAKFSTTNITGTAGFGLWDGDLPNANGVWFVMYGDSCHQFWQGTRCQVFDEGLFKHNELINLDYSQWHLYKIIKWSDSCKFYIDNQLVSSYLGITPTEKSKTTQWVDNTKVFLDHSYTFTKIPKNEKIYMDYSVLQSIDTTTTRINRQLQQTNDLINSDLTVFPNPFNSEVNINYYIRLHSKVEINIFNTNSQLVEKILSTSSQPGQYTIKFDSSDLSSGIYFCQLKTKYLTSFIKMILLK